MKGWIIGLCIALAYGNVTAADACDLVQFADDGKYIGGGLVDQIVRKAHTIQIVKATSRRVVTRTFSDGVSYLQSGEVDVSKGEPEYTDVFVYELTVVETIKSNPIVVPKFVYDAHPRVLAYGAREMLGATPNVRVNEIPTSLLERQGQNHHGFQAAQQGASPSLGSCNAPYYMNVGDMFLAFRDGEGRLYPADGAFPLAIDVEFRQQSGKPDRFSFAMQSLVPVQSDSAILAAVRAALASKR